jgi:hypothetical protein
LTNLGKVGRDHIVRERAEAAGKHQRFGLTGVVNEDRSIPTDPSEFDAQLAARIRYPQPPSGGDAMNWEAMGAIGDFLGAAGVIVSLLYLAFQIKLDREATIANTIQVNMNAMRELNMTMATSDRLASVFAAVSRSAGVPLRPAIQTLIDGFGLSVEDALSLGAFLTAGFRQAEATFRIPNTDLERGYSRIRFSGMLQSPVLDRWWEMEKHSGYPSTFVAEVERWRVRAA